MAKITGIKLLHKRYTLEQWEKGTGLSAIPTLAFGEFGIATDTNEVRCNTHTEGEISFASATLVSFPKFEETTATAPSKTYIESILLDKTASNGGAELKVTKATLPGVKVEYDGTGAFITGLRMKDGDDHTIIYELGDVPTSTLTITPVTGTIATGTETVAVVTKVEDNGTNGHEHKIKYETVNLPTKEYVDTKVADAEIDLVVAGEANGNYISNVEAANIDGVHTITVTKATLPESPKGTGEVDAGANSASVVASVNLNDHTLSGTTKVIEGGTTSSGNGEIVVTPSAGKIKITLNDNNYATKAEISMAMVFKGTIGATEDNPTITALPTATYETVGDTYKVITAGIIAAGEACDRGDLLICRKVNDSTYDWVRVPAGDDVDSFVASVSAGVGIEVKGGLNPTVSHVDYSAAESVVKDMAASTYGHTGKVITGLTVDSDDLGHVVTLDATSVDIVSEAGARKIAQEEQSFTTVTTSGPITITDTASAESNDHIYSIGHEKVTKTDSSSNAPELAASGTFQAVTGVTYNEYGHVSGVETKTFTLPEDKDSWRAVKVNGEEKLSSLTSTQALDLTAGQNITLDTSTTASNGKIVIKTLGEATSEALGFVKLGTDNVLNGDKVYSVGKDANGKLAVEVPWTDTDQYKQDHGDAGHYILSSFESTVDTNGNSTTTSSANYTQRALRFCAIGRDHGGHVVAAEDITVLDGNA